jgi:hypothetical protein
MIGKTRIDLSKPRQIACEEAIDEVHALTDIERLVDSQARTVKHPGMIAARVERDDDGSPGEEGNDYRPDPDLKMTNDEIPMANTGWRGLSGRIVDTDKLRTDLS